MMKNVNVKTKVWILYSPKLKYCMKDESILPKNSAALHALETAPVEYPPVYSNLL